MNLEPSFRALYRRSRYALETDLGPEPSNQRRHELFAVAAVAFVLKHEERFRSFFMRRICGSERALEHRGFSIEVQPHQHSDLAIKDERNSALYVIEFKIDADLEPIQDPANSEFADPKGYGQLITHEPTYERFREKTYVVLDQFSHSDQDVNVLSLTCRFRSWADLIPGTAINGLWADLLDSLGEINVASFQHRSLANMNNARFTPNVVAMRQTLIAVASKLRFGTNRVEDIGTEASEAWYGLKIPNRKLRNFLDLEISVGTNEEYLGWFGYQAGSGHSELAIWLYCGSTEKTGWTRKLLSQRLQKVVPGRIKIDGKHVCFDSEGRSDLGDKEWFEAVFSALSDRSKPKGPQASQRGVG